MIDPAVLIALVILGISTALMCARPTPCRQVMPHQISHLAQHYANMENGKRATPSRWFGVSEVRAPVSAEVERAREDISC